jgi:Na+-transporting NADH:ubiquinone oxidoreductase subunit NqrE
MTIASDIGRPASVRSFWLGVAAYLIPTFPIAFVWHLVLFEQKYHALGIYRDDPIIPLGLASMVIQSVIFSWVFPRSFAGNRDSILKDGLLYGLGAGLLSWSFTTLAVAAKHPMASISDYVVLETGFTILQFAIVGPLIALAWRR